MFLKSLTLRGFKSFADATTLQLEPGITVIVGPNGSGKSNIVDALTWVLGSMSAKTLRGGQMADVIYAGGQGRRAMGRASVQITIDNTDGALPIEFSEVTIGRAMFATGETSYTINDVECRLLDVQELLSDTGLGRENHTIVGQGRIDAVLNARPEERRAFIEEAAGILKHRRRKERALRKLQQMEAHLERLVDVLRELRRQLRPLERQAEAAKKHADLTAQLTAVRVERALRAYAQLVARWADDQAARSGSDERFAALDAELREQRAAEQLITEGLDELTPAVRAATETQFALANLLERAEGLTARIAERRNGLVEAVEEPVAGRDPDELRAEAASLRGMAGELDATLQAAQARLAEAAEARAAAEQARRAHEQAAAAEARRRAEARERRIRWEGEITALRGALAQAAAEEGRLDSQLQGQADRAAELDRDIAAVTAEIQRLDAAAPRLAEALAHAEQLVAKRQRIADEAVRVERELERRRASLEARADALFAASEQAGEGVRAVRQAAADGRLDGVLGPLADHLTVADGMAAAVAAALGPLGDALVVRGRAAAADTLQFVRDADSGRVLLLVSDPRVEPPTPPSLTELGATPLADAVDGPPGVRAAVRRALAGVYVVDDLDTAMFLAERRPELVLVTPDGELAGARGTAGGAAGTHTAVLSRAAAEEAQAQAEQVAAELLVAHRKVADADRELTAAREELEAAQAAMQESDGLITAAAERLGRLQKELARCRAEEDHLRRQHADLTRSAEDRRARLAELERTGPDGAGGPPDAPDDEDEQQARGDVEAERLEDAVAVAREQEVQARLAVSTAEQQRAELHRRIAALDAEADRVTRQLADLQRRREARLAAIQRCDQLERLAAAAHARAETSRAAAAAERDRLEEARAEQQRRLGVVRARRAELEEELGRLKDVRHREELARQELRQQLDRVRAHLADLGHPDADAALEEADEAVRTPDPDRERELEAKEESLSRKVALLGAVNPLALEEFHAMQERHDFLTEQLADLRASKKDLLQVVEAVDGRIREVFAEAFTEVAAQFERIFPLFFPGGSGRLVLTDPDDLLLTGVEVEARPPGKRVKRLSLLSGGERSLTALAVLFAIFAARPSPFYVLDEVEAALDDVNLQRFLHVLQDFRSLAAPVAGNGAAPSGPQILIVTHQRRTMEVADVLYGVSMASDGVSRVLSQRMTETALASH